MINNSIFSRLVWLPILALAGCNLDFEDTCEEAPIKVPTVSWFNMDAALEGVENEFEVLDLLQKHESYKQYFLESNQFPNDTILAKRVLRLVKNPSFDTLRRETNAVFGDQEELRFEFSMAFGKLKEYYPEAKVPKVYTTLTGLGKEMYLSDSLVIISLDYYIGQGATFRPINIADYILRRYEKEYIVQLVISYLSNAYNKVDNKNNSLLGEMIDYGKTYYFNKQILPCLSDTVITGYTLQELTTIEKNQETIWAHFIDRELLYETSHFVKNKYIGERPNVYEIGDACPGRIGRWVGLKIVQEYMNQNPEVTLQELMNETDVQEIFSKSRYKPSNK